MREDSKDTKRTLRGTFRFLFSPFRFLFLRLQRYIFLLKNAPCCISIVQQDICFLGEYYPCVESLLVDEDDMVLVLFSLLS